MNKHIHFKIIISIFIIGIIIIGLMGFQNVSKLHELKASISPDNEELNLQIETAKNETIVTTAIGIGVLAISLISIRIYLSKFVIYPINRLIKSAEKITNTEDNKNKIENNIDNVDDIFGLMTTELKDQLNDVSTKKNQIETILRHMTDGIIAFNMDKEIILINPEAKKLLSIRPEDVTFEDIFSKFKLDINMEKIIYLENWTSTEQRVQVEDKYINIFFAPFKNQDDRPDGVIAVVQDITEHVKLDNMRKEFVADVSHELKTPITSIIGYADTLQDGDYDKETQQRFLSVISSEGRRMADLVSDLLTLSRYDTNRMTREVTTFDLGEIAKKCQEKLAIEIEKKKQNVECYVTADVPPIEADKNGIERVILNVLSNAVKYTQEEGIIKIYVGFVYNDAYIKVIDNGIGIPKEDLARVFERFYRVDKARSREMGGTGLGLSIAKEIIEQNNGSIDIKSELGKGTEVVIRIPAVKKGTENE